MTEDNHYESLLSQRPLCFCNQSIEVIRRSSLLLLLSLVLESTSAGNSGSPLLGQEVWHPFDRTTTATAIFGRVRHNDSALANCLVIVTNKFTNELLGEALTEEREGKYNRFFWIEGNYLREPIKVFVFHEQIPGRFAYLEPQLRSGEKQFSPVTFDRSYAPGEMGIADKYNWYPKPNDGDISKMEWLLSKSRFKEIAGKIKEQISRLTQSQKKR